MKGLTFPKVALAILVVFAFLIRDDLFPSDHEGDEPAAAVPESEHGAPATAHDGRDAPRPEDAPPGETTAIAPSPEPARESLPEPTPDVAMTPADEPAAITPPPAAAPAPAPAAAPQAPAPAPAAATQADVTAPQNAEWSVTDYWIAARTAFLIGDLARAEQEYRQVLAVEPGNWFAHQELGNVYARSNRIDQAVHHYQVASLLLIKAAKYDDARQIALLMARLYPVWKDRVPEGLSAQ